MDLMYEAENKLLRRLLEGVQDLSNATAILTSLA
jgi:hypothetical protein